MQRLSTKMQGRRKTFSSVYTSRLSSRRLLFMLPLTYWRWRKVHLYAAMRRRLGAQIRDPSPCHLDGRVRGRAEWMGDGREVEGVEAPVLGRDALGPRAFNVAVFTQPGQLERMGVHQPKQIVLSPPPLFPPSRYQLSLILHSGTACRRRWLRQVMEPQAVFFFSLSLSVED